MIKKLRIPEGVHFLDLFLCDSVKWEDYIADKKTSCQCICNIESWDDGWDHYSDPKCKDTSCCNCIFWEGNAVKRVIYYKKCIKELHGKDCKKNAV